MFYTLSLPVYFKLSTKDEDNSCKHLYTYWSGGGSGCALTAEPTLRIRFPLQIVHNFAAHPSMMVTD